ncbi:unnamed protein product [Symbiodinium microadriaticum]|nr:unnamed protein product [Symbiodinium microadriaticum]
MGAGSSCKCDGKTESPGTPVEVVTIKDEEKHRENERSSPRGEVWIVQDCSGCELFKLDAVDYFDMFLSHTWATRGFGVQNFDAKCPFSGLGILVAMPVSVLDFFLAPYIPDVGKKQSCFLDVVSINQCDAKMMQEGIYGLQALVLSLFHFAAKGRYLGIPPAIRAIDILLFMYFCTLAIILYIVGFLTNFRNSEQFQSDFMESYQSRCLRIYEFARFGIVASLGGTVLLVVALLPLLGVFHLLRQNLSRKRQVFLALASFELSDASCRLASDQEFIYSAIQKWYGSLVPSGPGSLDAFTAYVRGPLRDELLKDHLGTNLPWYYGMLITTPWISLGMDALAALVRGDAPLHAILAYGIAMTLGLFTLWWLFTMQSLCLLEYTHAYHSLVEALKARNLDIRVLWNLRVPDLCN